MKIKRAIERLPGGLMLVPLLLGAVLHTFLPGTGPYFGSFNQGLITGVVPILAAWLFCLGASIRMRATGLVLRKSGALIGAKIGMAWLAALLLSRWLPIGGVQAGFFAGLSVLAVVAATALVAACVVVTAILTPIATTWWASRPAWRRLPGGAGANKGWE